LDGDKNNNINNTAAKANALMSIVPKTRSLVVIGALLQPLRQKRKCHPWLRFL